MESFLNKIKFFKVIGIKVIEYQGYNSRKVFFLKEILLIIKNRDLELLIGIMVMINIQVNGKMDKNMEMVFGKIYKEINILVNGSMEKFKDMVFIILQMHRNMKDIL